MKKNDCPKYLSDYRELWIDDPKKANLAWFKDAKFGLFLHYGLYSILERGEWVQYYEKIPLNEYEKLAGRFAAEKFDADRITWMALKAGAKYINITTCHHDGFCLWDSKIEPFNSVNTPCGRDLIKELSEACDRKGLGFFAYYTFMLNWRHPYFLPNSIFEYARPHYENTEPRYLYREKEDFKKYLTYIEAIMDELLSNYNIAGIWLDLIAAWYVLGPDYIPVEKIYANIRKKHPHVLISWKQGATGTEDFASPEDKFQSHEDYARQRFGEEGANRAKLGFEKNRRKHNEICTCVQKGAWGYKRGAENRSVEELYDALGNANENNCNLLLNIGPAADGAITAEHEKIFINLGEKITREGFPRGGDSVSRKISAGTE
jgi:alpha-L-fucosidase